MTPPDDAKLDRPRFTTSCTLDCPDSCALEVEVEGGRVAKVSAGDHHRVTRGFICSKVQRIERHLYGADRLHEPMVRKGPKGAGVFEEGAFETVSWEQALQLIAERIRTAQQSSGGESILPVSYGGSNGILSQDTADALLWRRLGASHLLRNVCAAPSTAAATGLYGKMAGVAPTDAEHAKLIIVWGCNPSATGIHWIPILKRAQEQGCYLVVIDPRRTQVAKLADLHLQPRPGTDLPLALALAHRLFESGAADEEFLRKHCAQVEEFRDRAALWPAERAAGVTGIPARSIEELADRYARTEPALVRCGWGLERNRNGGSAVASVLALPAIAGKFGVRGGGYTMSNSGVWSFPEVLDPIPDVRHINMNHIGTLLDGGADPAIDVVFVYNCNPLQTLPEQEKVRRGLEREDLFTVVFDQVATDTASYADVVLPATTFFEHTDIRKSYGSMLLLDAPAVVAPVSEARSNIDVFTDLLRRLELLKETDPQTVDDWRHRVLHSEQEEQLRERRIAEPPTGELPVQFVDALPATPDRKIHLVPQVLEDEASEGLYRYYEDPATDEFPIALLSPATNRTISSTFGQLESKPASVEVSPEDASARGLENGDPVRVFNRSGEVHCAVRVSHDVKPGVASLAKGLWARSTENGRTSNALAPDDLSDVGAGACFNDARVQIEAR